MKNDEFNTTSLDVYSSETKEWTTCPDVYPAKWFAGFGLYWNDAIYWVNFQFGKQPVSLHILSLVMLMNIRF